MLTDEQKICPVNVRIKLELQLNKKTSKSQAQIKCSIKEKEVGELASAESL